MKKQNKITKDMTFGEVFSTFPSKMQELAEVMMDYGLHCVGCPARAFDTIENGAKLHGLSGKKIENLISDLNKKLAKKRTAAPHRNT